MHFSRTDKDLLQLHYVGLCLGQLRFVSSQVTTHVFEMPQDFVFALDPIKFDVRLKEVDDFASHLSLRNSLVRHKHMTKAAMP